MDAIFLSGVSGLMVGSFTTAYVLTKNKALKSNSAQPDKAKWDADVDPWVDIKSN